MNAALNINTYAADGLIKVCDVVRDTENRWFYENINEAMMFSEHRSWVYFIVVDEEIVKVGETGNPLGVRMKTGNQPKMGSEGRFGRYRAGDNTDWYIREELRTEVRQGRVSLWARRCEMVALTVSVAGCEDSTMTSFHKDLEMRYLDYIFSQTGNLPRLNKARK
jgi:hypothetical protein